VRSFIGKKFAGDDDSCDGDLSRGGSLNDSSLHDDSLHDGSVDAVHCKGFLPLWRSARGIVKLARRRIPGKVSKKVVVRQFEIALKGQAFSPAASCAESMRL
jgi:hypothetical protein